MRLLNTRTKRLQEFNQPRLPYAILSHTWGAEEVSLQDLVSGNSASLQGYKKLEGACEQALRDGFDYIVSLKADQIAYPNDCHHRCEANVDLC